MAKSRVSLADRFDLGKSRVILGGQQAIVRLMLMQKARDEARGLNTAGFVTGYRGSPLGALDIQFTREKALVEAHDIHFQPGINEELAATAIWGAQQAAMRGEGTRDGVFCVWYGKGPGVDRCGDVFRHANSAGSAEHGGVLVLMGDDHGAESSTVPHQSEFTLIDAMMPILNPAGVQEILDYGILGYALSRYSGCWVGLKCLHDTIESTAVVDAAPDRVTVREPEDFAMPEGGLNIRPGDDRFTLEKRLHTYKRAAAQAFARANGLDKIVWDGGDDPVLGIVSTGKSWLDTRQALADLGIDETRAGELGVRLLKIGMTWPLEPRIIRRFARGLRAILVVEEKRAIIETQIRELLFNSPERPVITGKEDEEGKTLLPAHGVLDPAMIAKAIGGRLLPLRGDDEALKAALAAMENAGAGAANLPAPMERVPWFCAGCPHNTSTKVPEGARAYAGIGCHWLVQLMDDRNTKGFTQMGCEGANWIGEAPFSRRRHIFQNIGDGTYVHSGLMAIRACRAAGVNITFKILCNDAVAMTGGQPMDGGLTVPQIAGQTRAEGCERIAVVSDEPEKWAGVPFPPRVTFHHRDELMEVQREMENVPGVSILIYDQTCAAEKRRRRKRGRYPDPARYVVINEAVCEGCGDCSARSNCVAITPVETPWGRKRRIDQSVCNRDYTCLEGFCPAMVTVEGARPKAAGKARSATPPAAPMPQLPDLARPWSMLIAGIGGTGVVTIGQIIAHAAHIAGLGAALIDMSGISQKNGTVFTHLKIAERPEDISAIRAAAGGADAIVGCDLLTCASDRILYAASPGRTRAVVNSHQVMPAQFTHDPDMPWPAGLLKMRIEAATGKDGARFADTAALARNLLGDAIFANMTGLGMSWQAGLVPVPLEAMEEAIRLNGVAVEQNLAAFAWGRAAAHDLAAVEKLAGLNTEDAPEDTLEAIIARGEALLRDYQDADYARQYREFIETIRALERQRTGGEALTRAAARQLARLMAIKDEYEVARLYADPAFAERIAREFGEGARLRPHFAPPLLTAKKRPWPLWTMKLMPLLARLKGLRGTPFDIFGYTGERRAERAFIGEYRDLVTRLAENLTEENAREAAQTAALAEKVRGFGPLRRKAMEDFRAATAARMNRDA